MTEDRPKWSESPIPTPKWQEGKDYQSETGSPYVDEWVGIRVDGVTVSPSWYREIKTETGAVDAIAVSILAEIVWWTMPAWVRDEATGNVVGYKRRWYSSGVKLRRSYAAFAEFFGYTKRQVTDAMHRLAKQGLIDMEFCDDKLDDGMRLYNVLYVVANKDAVMKITYPVKLESHLRASPTKTGDLPRQNVIPPLSKGDTKRDLLLDLHIVNTSPSAKNADGALPAPPILETKPLPLEDTLAPKNVSAAAEPLASVVGVKIVKNAGLPPEGVLLVVPAAAPQPPVRKGMRFAAKMPCLTEVATNAYLAAIGKSAAGTNQTQYRSIQAKMRDLLGLDKNGKQNGHKGYTTEQIAGCAGVLYESGVTCTPGLVAQVIDIFIEDNELFPPLWLKPKKQRPPKVDRDAMADGVKATAMARAAGLIS
jgi:hypothetical protein